MNGLLPWERVGTTAPLTLDRIFFTQYEENRLMR
jgi:hypothetical protein